MKRKFLNFIQQARVLGVIKCIIEFLIGREAHKQKKIFSSRSGERQNYFCNSWLENKIFFTKENLILHPMFIYAYNELYFIHLHRIPVMTNLYWVYISKT